MMQLKISLALLPLALLVVADIAAAQRRASRSSPRATRSAARSAPRPVQRAARPQAPRRSTPSRRAPSRSTPSRRAPSRSTPTRTRSFTPTRRTPTRTTPTRRTPTRYTPTRRTPTRTTPTRRTPTRYTPTRTTPTRRTPTRTTPTRYTPSRAPTRRTPIAPISNRYTRPSTPVRVRYNTRPRTNSGASLRDVHRRVPSTRPDSGANHRTGGVRDNINARAGNRYSRDIRRHQPTQPTTGGTRKPIVSNRYKSNRPVTTDSRNPRLRDGGRFTGGTNRRVPTVPTVRTGGAGRQPRTNGRQPRINTRVNRTINRPRRTIRKHASHHYRYGGSSPRHHSALGDLLGLGWVGHLGWSNWSHYAYDPYYSNYYVGHGYHHYHWDSYYYHPLNYTDWCYPTTYYPTSYIYVNSRGDYSPYASTRVLVDDRAPAEEAPAAAPAEVKKASAETLIKRHVTLGDFYFKEKRYSEASESYLRALAHAPEDPTLHFVLADALFALGDYHYAAFVIQKALRLDPALAFAEADKRTFYADPKEFETHMATILSYVKEKPFDVAGHLVLGYNYKFSKQKDKAIAAFQRMLELSPKNEAAKLFVEALTEPPADKEAKDSVKRTDRRSKVGTKKPAKKDR